MKSKILLPAVCALTALVPLTSSAVPSSPAPAVASPFALAGIWDVAGEPDSSSGVPPFTNITSFSVDGTMVNLDTSEGTGLGRCSRSGPGTFDIGFLGYLDLGFPAVYEVSSTVQVDSPDTFHGPFLTTVTDLDGNFLFEYEGMVHGSRRSFGGF